MAFAMPFETDEMLEAPDAGRELPSADSIRPTGALWAGTWAGQQTYAVAAVFPDGSSGLVPCSALSWEEQTDELAGRISAEFPDDNLEDGRPLSSLITLGTPLTVLAALQPHLELVEVARGMVDEVSPSDGHGGTFSVIAYDPIHALLTSEIDIAFGSGQGIGNAIRSVCEEWSITLADLDQQLDDASTSGSMVFHGETLADVLTKLLAQVPMPEGEFSSGRWVWRMTAGVLEAVQVGKSSPVYWLQERQSALSTSARVDASAVVSKIVITGVSTGGGADFEPFVAQSTDAPNRVIGTYEGADQSRGTRQAILNITDNMSVEDVERKAREMFAQKGYPRYDRSIEAPDIPMIRRYDQVRVTAGSLDGYFAIESISHDQGAATMSLKLGNLQTVPLEGTFTLIDASAIPPPSSTGTGSSAGSGQYVGLSGPVSAAQVCALARAAGFADPVTATAISRAENGSGNLSAMSATRDIGLWQINETWWPKFGGQAALTDAMNNAKAAKAIFDVQGWGAWSTYKGGQYRSHLDEAAAACAQNAQLPSQSSAMSTGSGASTSALAAAIQPWLGVPYVFGGTSKSGVDCSGFTQAVYKQLGVGLPRVAQAQYDATRRVPSGQEQPGDLVFFSGTYNSGSPVSHVGIVANPNTKEMIHCGDP